MQGPKSLVAKFIKKILAAAIVPPL